MTAPLALTSGDPAGIGPEITLSAWQRLRNALPFVLIGDADHMSVLGRKREVPVERVSTVADAAKVMPRALPVLHQPLASAPIAGKPDLANASATIASIDRAVALAQDGTAAAVVTNPISKKVLVDGAGFAHPGHTEYLAALGGVSRSVMMLVAPDLRAVPVTIHVPISAVPELLTPALITETIRIVHTALRRDFSIAAPRIAVAGLNPHAGEAGLMGTEDESVIRPALDALRAEGMDLRGPLPADTMFHPPARAGYDAAVCMYHDQALIPVKTLGFSVGVNVTLGLPFVRTSPDHGTAFDIAGKGQADPDSLVEALRQAQQIAANRGTS
ncbi:MAG: 4-hydroxythreonine-4-phosphate dehydrogenase PdxA [Rhodobacteraceae bacterium]|nr:4-hydroxythreonine-4-phosphate dehydrogenase PdxA [Paracoccaceae bacterium]